MNTLSMCPIAWDLYEKWDKLCTVTHEMTPDEVEAENTAWKEYLDHKAKCDICRKDEA